MTRLLSSQEVKTAVHAGTEVALLDVREAGPFSEGHPLFAVPCPYSRFELLLADLVPRRDAPVILLDGGDGIAERAAAAAAGMGYSDVSVLEGGAPGWAAAGFTLYKGVNVPSKTLGELAEITRHPRMIDARTLAAWKEEGREFRFFDCRPAPEYAKMRVPGSVCLPNGELAHRFAVAVPGDGPVVITCAGRTRGIIGSLGLSLAGIEGEIYALENGTQGWALAGHRLERGNVADPLPPLDDAARAATRQRAEAFITREGLPVIDAAAADALRADPARTTYLLDIRSAAEARDDPLPAFRHALSGQLVQATDQWVGVRHARIVLADDLGLRAAIAAFWLRSLGFDARILPIDDTVRALRPVLHPAAKAGCTICSATGVLAALRAGTGRVVDLRRSEAYGKAHVAGSAWGIRPYLDRLRGVGGHDLFVVAETESEAALGVRDLEALGHRSVGLVSGGIDALKAAGAAMEHLPKPMPLSQAIDITSFAHGRHDGDLSASQLYLDWEQGLVAQLDPEERAEFRI